MRRLLGQIPVEWIGDEERIAKGIVIFLHGGGFTIRAPRTDRRFCFDLKRRLGLSIVLVPYRLAPEYPFPHGLDDCYQVYAALIDAGVSPRNIILIGHSAGANLALAVLMRARQNGIPQPAGAALLSTPTDMTGQSPSITANEPFDVMQGPNIWPWVREKYLRGGASDHPEVSPLFASWAGLAPLSLHVSDSEVLLDDSRRALAQAQAEGLEVDLKIWEKVPHNFYFLDFLPEHEEFQRLLEEFVKNAIHGKTLVPL
ncbi:alpha/beta hydrolase [Herbaspirillum sp. C7C2]|uniref:alpha/beta hydrolase n=1 Tax=Herbaspirillum sp. C7C2 TaxID=2736666 RepID=UPI001F51B1DC|nr:alpha/beta hydrolase [Herbaspirillum sp. C7C2]MCI1016882.1 alpha/beta hydrolase [Herbaspirillum sp. C7C2]